MMLGRTNPLPHLFQLSLSLSLSLSHISALIFLKFLSPQNVIKMWKNYKEMHDHMTLQADQILLKIFYIIKTIFLNLCHMTRRKIQKYYSYYFCFCYFQSWTILDSNLTLLYSLLNKTFL